MPLREGRIGNVGEFKSGFLCAPGLEVLKSRSDEISTGFGAGSVDGEAKTDIIPDLRTVVTWVQATRRKQINQVVPEITGVPETAIMEC